MGTLWLRSTVQIYFAAKYNLATRAAERNSLKARKKFSLKVLLASLILSSSSIDAFGIYGGSESIKNDVVVGILGSQYSTSAGCSGGLVAPQVVFTAAHCLYGAGETWIAAPGSDLRDTKTLRIQAKTIFMPKDFTTATFPYNNDFAIILLKAPFPNTSPIEIATASQIAEWVNGSSEVLHVGYGCTKLVDSPPCGLTSPIPFEFSTNLVKEIPPQFSSLKINTFTLTRISVEKTICGGDSGSPLLKYSDGKWIYVGAQSSSNGAGCTKSCNINCVASQGLASSNPELIEQVKSYLVSASQGPVISPSPSTSASAKSATQSKLRTIQCYSGKKIKKVTGANPKCPKGYKKK
jgi:hypothetical protein